MSKGPKLTRWFEAHVRPDLPGVYEVQTTWLPCGRARWFRRWDGEFWYVGSERPASAARVRARVGPGGETKWRGLAEPLQ